MNKSLLIVFILALSIGLHAQNRVSEHNTIGWYMYFGDHKISSKFGVHTEYQWRRVDIIKTWQQSLARVGINYSIEKNVLFTLGYGHIQTYPYSFRPIASTGYAFPEHRLYEQIVLKNPTGRLDISHRFRLEQRWLAKLRRNEGPEIFGWNYLNRVRYMFRINIPLKGNTLEDKEFYLGLYDEIFIQFGKRVANNIFDQNRIYGAIGYKVNSEMKIELGFLNQIVQHGRGDVLTLKPVYEYNNGLQASLIYNFDFSKAE